MEFKKNQLVEVEIDDMGNEGEDVLSSIGLMKSSWSINLIR